MKIIIVGGVAGGASCAARLRRLDEKAKILMVERGPYVSFANCGLPYHVGGFIGLEMAENLVHRGLEVTLVERLNQVMPLAGPANRQGRIVADVICGRKSRYRGTQGTSICKLFEGTIAQTGASEKVLTQIGDSDFEKIYLYPNSHAGYYPGASQPSRNLLIGQVHAPRPADVLRRRPSRARRNTPRVRLPIA
jgi:NADPH-dependent 2,4-dienoyl-CoA reductase/sulfur reductase-like enzyme